MVFQIASHVWMSMNVNQIHAVLKMEFSTGEMKLNAGRDSRTFLRRSDQSNIIYILYRFSKQGRSGKNCESDFKEIFLVHMNVFVQTCSRILETSVTQQTQMRIHMTTLMIQAVPAPAVFQAVLQAVRQAVQLVLLPQPVPPQPRSRHRPQPKIINRLQYQEILKQFHRRYRQHLRPQNQILVQPTMMQPIMTHPMMISKKLVSFQKTQDCFQQSCIHCAAYITRSNHRLKCMIGEYLKSDVCRWWRRLCRSCSSHCCNYNLLQKEKEKF